MGIKYYFAVGEANYCGIHDSFIVSGEELSFNEAMNYALEEWEQQKDDYEFKTDDDEDELEFYLQLEEITKAEFETEYEDYQNFIIK